MANERGACGREAGGRRAAAARDARTNAAAERGRRERGNARAGSAEDGVARRSAAGASGGGDPRREGADPNEAAEARSRARDAARRHIADDAPTGVAVPARVAREARASRAATFRCDERRRRRSAARDDDDDAPTTFQHFRRCLSPRVVRRRWSAHFPPSAAMDVLHTDIVVVDGRSFRVQSGSGSRSGARGGRGARPSPASADPETAPAAALPPPADVARASDGAWFATVSADATLARRALEPERVAEIARDLGASVLTPRDAAWTGPGDDGVRAKIGEILVRAPDARAASERARASPPSPTPPSATPTSPTPTSSASRSSSARAAPSSRPPRARSATGRCVASPTYTAPETRRRRATPPGAPRRPRPRPPRSAIRGECTSNCSP